MSGENDGAPGWTSGPDGLGPPDASGDAALDLPAEGGTPARHPFAVTEGRRYEEVAELGRGGMGRVMLAVDQRLQRQVAKKQIAAGVRGRPAALQRFAREAWITASLDHPAIVPVFDAGVDERGELFYTMRLVRGRTLGSALRAAPDQEARLLLLRHFLVACEAIAYAHSMGVVHRDLKPDNILVGEYGETQVVDWGVARRLDEPLAPAGLDAAAPFATTDGAVAGTPGYMSPEQAAGAAPHPSADVFSLGMVLFEIVHGPPASQGPPTEPARPAAAPRGSAPAAPPELIAILHHALRPVGERYPDAKALAADVARYLDGSRVHAHRYTALDGLRLLARRYRAPVTVAAVALLLLGVLGLWAFARTRAERDRAVAAEQQTRAALEVSRQHLARSLAERAQAALLQNAQPEAEVLAVNALSMAELPEARGVLAAFGFSGRPTLREQVPLPKCTWAEPRADGAVLCANRDEVLLLSGRPLRTQWRVALANRGASWAADGAMALVLPDQPAALLLDGESGRVLHRLEGARYWEYLGHAPAGPLAVALSNPEVVIIDTRTGAHPVVEPCSGEHLTATANSTGTRVAVACRDGSVALFGPDGAAQGRLQTDISGPRGHLGGVGVSPDGALLVITSTVGEAQSLDAGTGRVVARRQVNTGVIRKVTFSPDGRWVALLGDLGAIDVLDARSLTILRRLPVARDLSLRWTPQPADRDVIELSTAGQALHRWALPLRQPALSLMEARPPGLSSAELSPDGGQLAVSAGDGTLTVIDVGSGQRLFTDKFQRGVLMGAHFLGSAAGKGLLAWGADLPAVRRYDEQWRVLDTLPYPILRRAAQLASGWMLLAHYGYGVVLARPGATPPTGLPLRPGDDLFLDLSETEDGRRALLLETGGHLWWADDVEGGAPPTLRRWLDRPAAKAVAVSGDGAVAAVGERGAIELFDAATGATRLRFEDDPGQVIDDLALSRDGALVAVGGLDHHARLYSGKDGRLLALLRGHQGRVAKVSFSRDGRTLTTASWDGSARNWDVRALTRPAEEMRREIEQAWGLDLAAVTRGGH